MDYAIVVKLMADGLVIPIVLIGIYVLVFRIDKKNRIEIYKRILIAGLSSYLIAKLASFVYQPEGSRPFELLGLSAGASFLNNPGFPSDHMLFVTAITLAVWFETKNVRITLILAVLSLAVGIGRILALVHTPIDVLGGIVIALIGALWYLNDGQKGEKNGNSIKN